MDIETRGELLGERAAWTFAQHCNFGAQIVTRLEIGFLLPALVHALVVGAQADDPIAVIQQF